MLVHGVGVVHGFGVEGGMLVMAPQQGLLNRGYNVCGLHVASVVLQVR